MWLDALGRKQGVLRRRPAVFSVGTELFQMEEFAGRALEFAEFGSDEPVGDRDRCPVECVLSRGSPFQTSSSRSGAGKSWHCPLYHHVSQCVPCKHEDPTRAQMTPGTEGEALAALIRGIVAAAPARSACSTPGSRNSSRRTSGSSPMISECRPRIWFEMFSKKYSPWSTAFPTIWVA